MTIRHIIQSKVRQILPAETTESCEELGDVVGGLHMSSLMSGRYVGNWPVRLETFRSFVPSALLEIIQL